MRKNSAFNLSALVCLAALTSLVFVIGSCSNDENSNPPPPSSASLISVEYANCRVIEVDAARHLALLLHDHTAPSGTAIELVDVASRTMIASRILDYFDLFDIKFISATEGCFAGRPQGNIGYSVQFFSLPDLTLGTRVMTAALEGEPGTLAVDSAAGYVYYSHAGGNGFDGLYKIRIATKQIVDADDDGAAPYALDNDLVAGLFSQPAQIFYDRSSQKIVVANLSANYVTILNASLWGTLSRVSNLSFPIEGATHLSTDNGEVSDARAVRMAYGAGVYVFAGVSNGQWYLGRFGVNSVGLDLLTTFPGRTWLLDKASLRVHPHEEVFSVFVLEEDTGGVAVGQYRLNNLVEVDASPYRPHQLPDSVVATFGLDSESDQLILADSERNRLELISTQ